jgi:glycine/D-amino acid oxidase-like deaminating enzyme
VTTTQTTAYERHAPAPHVVAQALSGTERSVYWIEEAGPADPRPFLGHSTRADLAIVGGGYLGLWTALLAKRRNPGQRVALLEAETVGWAASGRNGGFCEASITHGAENGRTRWPDEYPVLERLGRENLDAFEQDVRTLEINCHWERTGTLRVAVEPHQRAWLVAEPDAMSGDEVRGEINSPLFLGGTRQPDDCALLQPARLARELARLASESGVEIFEHSPVAHLETTRRGPVRIHTSRTTVTAQQVVLATNAFHPLLRRNRLLTVPVYDYVLMTEALTSAQLASIGWQGRQGLADMANQFHYSRLTKDNRILFGGYDAIYHAGRKTRSSYEERPQTYERLASHFFAMFPQLEGLRFTHRWAGVIDTSTRFTAFYGTARHGQVAYAAGFTGLGVGATRFAANVVLDLLSGQQTERTGLRMVRERPLPFPPEPVASIGINLTRWSLDRADHREGHRNLFLRTLDAVGLGFDS